MAGLSAAFTASFTVQLAALSMLSAYRGLMQLSRKGVLESEDIDAAPAAASGNSRPSNPVRVAVAGRASQKVQTFELMSALRIAGLHPVWCERHVNLATEDQRTEFDAFVHYASASAFGWRADLIESTRHALGAPLLAVIEQPKPDDLLCALEIGAHAVLPLEVGADVLVMQVRRLATIPPMRNETITSDEVTFNKSERRLLRVLNAKRGHLVPYEVLVEAAGLATDAYDALGLLRVKMCRLRKKLGNRRALKCCRNAGYILHLPQKNGEHARGMQSLRANSGNGRGQPSAVKVG